MGVGGARRDPRGEHNEDEEDEDEEEEELLLCQLRQLLLLCFPFSLLALQTRM